MALIISDVKGLIPVVYQINFGLMLVL